MKKAQEFLLFAVSAVLLVSFANCGKFSCQPTILGRTYDLTSLLSPNGSWIWVAPLNGSNSNVIWQVQLCDDVKQEFEACTTPSPVNLITEDRKNCTALGDSNVYAWDEVPYLDGIRLTYFHGAAIDHIEWYSSTIYIVCNPSANVPIIFEHTRSCMDKTVGFELGGQFHFKIQTKIVC